MNNSSTLTSVTKNENSTNGPLIRVRRQTDDGSSKTFSSVQNLLLFEFYYLQGQFLGTRKGSKLCRLTLLNAEKMFTFSAAVYKQLKKILLI